MLPSEKGRERHRKFLGAQAWHLKAVIETLPTLLQLSFFFFFIAQVDFFWPINTTVATTITIFASISFSFYIGTTLIATFASGSPFQTRLSALLRRVKAHFMPNHEEDDNDVVGANCVYWLLQTTTLPDALVESVKASTTLSVTARDRLHLDVSKVLQSLLRPSIVDYKIQWGISTESLRSPLPELLQLLQTFEVTSWNDFLPAAPTDLVQRSMRGILVKLVLSPSSDAETTTWVSNILSLPSLREGEDSTDLDPLHTFFLQNLPILLSNDELYTKIATICLHIKAASLATDVALALGTQFESLQQHISSLSLDSFFNIPTNSSQLIQLHHPSFVSFIGHHERCLDRTLHKALNSARDRFEAQRLADLVSSNNLKFSRNATHRAQSPYPPLFKLCNSRPFLFILSAKPTIPKLGRICLACY